MKNPARTETPAQMAAIARMWIAAGSPRDSRGRLLPLRYRAALAAFNAKKAA